MKGQPSCHRTFRPLILCLVTLISVAACGPRGPTVLIHDPILALGHGTFLGADGTPVTPDRAFIVVSAQRYYMDLLVEQAKGRDTLAVNRAQKFIRGLVTDEILANALFIDWLIENVQPANTANLTSIKQCASLALSRAVRPQEALVGRHENEGNRRGPCREARSGRRQGLVQKGPPGETPPAVRCDNLPDRRSIIGSSVTATWS